MLIVIFYKISQKIHTFDLDDPSLNRLLSEWHHYYSWSKLCSSLICGKRLHAIFLSFPWKV